MNNTNITPIIEDLVHDVLVGIELPDKEDWIIITRGIYTCVFYQENKSTIFFCGYIVEDNPLHNGMLEVIIPNNTRSKLFFNKDAAVAAIKYLKDVDGRNSIELK